MRRYIIAGLLTVAIVILLEMIVDFVGDQMERTEIIEDTELIEEQERTNEEYISIFLDNREDFEYVAGIMQKWDFGSIYFEREGVTYGNPKTGKSVMIQEWTFGRIYFKEDDMINGNSEIAEEIATNKEFFRHLKNLYDLNEVSNISQRSDYIEFGFENPPKDYHGGWYYWEDTEEGGLMKTAVIDEHWTLEMLPNI